MNAWILRPLPIASAVASGTAAGFSATNVATDYAGVVWRSSGAAANLNLDLGADVPVDTAMMFGLANLGNSTFTIALATAAQGPGFSGTNTSSGVGNGNYWSGAWGPLTGNLLTNGKGVAQWSAPISGGPPASVRYVLIIFPSLTGAIEVSRVVIGKRIELARNFEFGGTFGVRDFGTTEFSSRGALLRRRGKKIRVTSISFPNAYRDEIEAQIQPLLELAGNSEPIALITDPAADAMRQRRSYFGPLVGDLSTTWRTATGWEFRASLPSIF